MISSQASVKKAKSFVWKRSTFRTSGKLKKLTPNNNSHLTHIANGRPFDPDSKRKTFSYQVSKPEDGLVDIEWIVHVSIDQSRGVDESDERELLGLGRRDLGVDVVNQPVKLSQGLEVRVQVEGGVPGQGLPLTATETNTHFNLLSRRRK